MVFLVVFIDLLGFGLVLPVLPRYGEGFVAHLLPHEIVTIQDADGTRSVARVLPGYEWAQGTVTGLLYASFSLMQFLFAPLWGRFSDRVGRRPVLLLGLGGSVVFYAIFGLGSELGGGPWAALGLGLLFVARIGAGVAGATISTAQAVIADSTTPEGRSRGMALIGAAFGLGFSFGPAIGAGALWLAPGWYGLPAYLAAGLSALALVLGWARLPETRRPGLAAPHRGRVSAQQLFGVLTMPGVGGLVLMFFLATFAFAMLETTLAVLTKAFGFSDRWNFVIFSGVGFTLMVAQGAIYRPLARRVPETVFLPIGALLLTAGLVVLAVLAGSADPSRWDNSTLAGMLAAMTTSVFGFAFLTPSAQSLISRRSDPARQGEVLGVNQSASALARILGPLVGLTLFYLRPHEHGLPYWFGAGLLVAVFLLVLWLPRVPDAEAGRTARA
jgi:MFS family permease